MLFFCVLFRLTTYLTIDRFGAHGNNGYKTAKENFVWNRNGYKKAFVVERAISALFGSIEPSERVIELFVAHCL